MYLTLSPKDAVDHFTTVEIGESLAVMLSTSGKIKKLHTVKKLLHAILAMYMSIMLCQTRQDEKAACPTKGFLK